MFLDASDFRPRSLLDPAPPTRAQIGAGLLAVLAAYVGLPVLVAVVRLAWLSIVWLLSLGGVDVESALAPEPPPPPPPHVVQAHFLQLGQELDPHQLPNRRVPILRTDTPEPAPSRRADPTRPPPERREHQRDSTTDALQRLSEEAQTFAEREERRVQEGDPEGVEGGDREAAEGDLYAGRLSIFFRRGWQVPTTLDRDELAELTTVVSVHIGTDLRVESFRLLRSSANDDYDLAVRQQLERLIAAQATVPDPPSSVAVDYVGRDITFRYRGRDAH